MSDRLAKDAKLQRKILENKQMRSMTDLLMIVTIESCSRSLQHKNPVFHQHEIAKKMEECYF